MSDTTHIKIKYILLRYRSETEGLGDAERLLKLIDWIEKCTRAEEYEMAHALFQVKQSLIARIENKNKKPTPFWRRIVISFKLMIRKWRT